MQAKERDVKENKSGLALATREEGVLALEYFLFIKEKLVNRDYSFDRDES